MQAVSEMTPLSGEKNNWNTSFSLLRVIACLGIVLLHTANVSELLYPEVSARVCPGLAMGIVYSMMWAVPCFLMISGALLLDPDREITPERLRDRYIRRIALALLICCVLFSLIDTLMNGDAFSLLFIADGVYRLFTGGSWAHLWYLYLLLGLYLLLPFYRLITKHSSDGLLKYLLVLYAVFLSVLPVFGAFGIDIAFTIQTAGIYPFYFFVGYALNSGKLEFSTRTLAAMAIGGTVIIWVMCALSGWQEFPMGAEFQEILGSYASPAVALQSVGIFGLVRRIPQEKIKEKWAESIRWIDACTFGAYLIHMAFLRLFLRYLSWDLFAIGEWSIFVFAVGTFLLSLLITQLLGAIKPLRAVL